MTKVLLTTIPLPFGEIIPGVHLADAYTSRFSKHQGIFSFESVTPYMGVYVIANNIAAPAVVLENPTWDGFRRELEHGYDWVGIGFNNYGITKTLEMCRHVRRTFPNTRIVLGGYGVQGLQEHLREHPEDRSLYDHACAEDGVAFMRGLLGEDVSAPVNQECPPVWIYPFRVRAQKRPLGCMTVSYGCRKHCPYCCAPFHYDSKRSVMSADEIVTLTKRYLEKHPGLNFISLVGENYLDDHDLVRAVAARLAEEPQLASRVGYAVTSNVLSVSRWDPYDLARAGVGSVFLCIPSKFDAHRKLSDEEVRAVFDGLHRVGIVTTGSFVIGQDFHTPENLAEDIDYYVGLNPVTPQVVCYPPAPGTPHWEKMRKENRIKLKRWEDQHQYAENIVFKHFPEGAISRAAESTYRRFFETWGSSYLCNFDCWLQGVENLRGSEEAVLRARAALYEPFCVEGYATLLAHEVFAPSPQAAQRASRAKRNYRRILGRPRVLASAASLGVLGLMAYYRYVRYPVGFPVAQPPTVRKTYNGAV